MSVTPATPQKPWYQHAYLWLVILLPVLAVCVSLWFVSMAFKHQDDLVRDDWYMDGKTLQQDLSRDTAAVQQQVYATLNLAADGTVVMQVKAKQGTDLPPLLFINLYHPTHAAQDQKMTLKATDVAGQYQGKLAQLPSLVGRYHLEVEDGEIWRLQRDVSLPTTQLTLAPQAVVR